MVTHKGAGALGRSEKQVPGLIFNVTPSVHLLDRSGARGLGALPRSRREVGGDPGSHETGKRWRKYQSYLKKKKMYPVSLEGECCPFHSGTLKGHPIYIWIPIRIDMTLSAISVDEMQLLHESHQSAKTNPIRRLRDHEQWLCPTPPALGAQSRKSSHQPTQECTSNKLYMKR